MNWWARSTKKVRTVVINYVESLLTLDSAVSGCISISAFASLVDISIGITSYSVRLKVCAVTSGIKKQNSITETKSKTMIK